jgi:hypothetical protein
MSGPHTATYTSDELVRLAEEKMISYAESVSSCPSDSSDDDESDQPLFRLKHTLVSSRANPSDHPKYSVIGHKSNPDKSIIIIPRFLGAKRLNKLSAVLSTSALVYPIEDRKSNLIYAHTARRAELALRVEYQRMYSRIIETSVSLFDEVYPTPFAKLCRKKKFYPEMEYIVYDAERDPSASIEPHVDNHAILTGILMLSDPWTDFTGGVNFFKGSESSETNDSSRSYKLQKGDCVLFRGELLSHWISPVDSGVRKILQWEFSRI